MGAHNRYINKFHNKQAKDKTMKDNIYSKKIYKFTLFKVNQKRFFHLCGA